MSDPDVLIIGGGLAGLACARHLHGAGVSFELLEASDGLGGRVRTDSVEGFQLDRGFQVLLSAYPETQRQLDYDALDLHAFYDGAMVRYGGRFHEIGDPFRHPLDLLPTLVSPVGTVTDKARIGRLRLALTRTSLPELFARDETTTIEALRHRWRFSDRIIERFFRPFFGGIFLDASLKASSRMFEFVFKMFAEGRAVLPDAGMEALPRQIAASLPADSIHLNMPVTAIDKQQVLLDDGTAHTAPAIVVATEAPTARILLGDDAPSGGHSTTCLYYAASTSPLDTPKLVLNGEQYGPINTLCVPSDVAPSYAPADRALVSVTVLGNPGDADDVVERNVRAQLVDWFGRAAAEWTHLRTYRIRYALPDQAPPFLSPPKKPIRRRTGLYVCGDHTRTASLNGAIASGRAAAQAVLADHRVPA